MTDRTMLLTTRKRIRTEAHAQALTEFALTLTILLLVVYGLLEVGRLLFVYSSTVTAARQAVRYGSATGENELGTPYYEDCEGIRDAVHNVGFINSFDDADILIAYDRGINSDGSIKQIDDLNPDPDCDNDIAGMEIQNGDRIRVQVSTHWQPIVPLVPLDPFTITAESSRTILSSISIQVTAPASGWSGTGGGELSLGVSASPSTFNSLGQTITYTYTVTNTGTATISGTFTIEDSPVSSNNCIATAPASLGVSASFTCTGTYQITQQDLDDGFVTDVAQVTGPLFSNQAGVTISASQGPALSLVKSGSPDASAIPGTVISYTFTVTNSGNVTLRAPYAIIDDQTGDETCPSTPSTLAPGASVVCTATTTIKQSDVNAGTLINHATATALFGFVTVTSNTASFTVWTPPVYLTISTSTASVNAAGQVITYTYHLKNNTDSNMTSPFTVADSRTTNESCAGATSPLVSGATNNCTGSYTVTQADMDAGTAITGMVTATAKQNPGNKTRTSNQVLTSVPILQAPALSLTLNANPTTATVAGSVITYTYTLTNSGNVTLTAPYAVTDDQVALVTCSDPSASLAPGASKTCTGSHTITQADLDNGSLINVAAASAKFGTQTVSSGQATATVATYNGNRLSLNKTANFTTVVGVGQVITYTYELHNTGNGPLTGLAVLDDKISGVDCSLAQNPLPVGKKTTCTGTYITTQADVDAGHVTNQATATAQSGTQTIVSDTKVVTVLVTPP